MAEGETPPVARWSRPEGAVVLELEGDWLRDGPPYQIEGDAPDQAPDRYDTTGLGAFDSTLPAFILAHLRAVNVSPRESGASAKSSKPPLEGLPAGLLGLMELALAVPEEFEANKEPATSSEIKKLGTISIHVWEIFQRVADFIGQAVLSLGRFVSGRARFRAHDFWAILQECGAQALPIVSLISFLIGLILAFVGNVQLANFGAGLYVADLVGIAMVREMGVVMTSIIMSGRTGAAFAAHLGSMKVNQEIDALRTFGFNPFDFLVLPRLLALVLMLPILTVYSNIIGILGGMVVGATVGIPPILYWNETLASVTMTTASLGVFKSVFFGAAIALSGCLQGMNCENSSIGVGEATTRAVVASITAIIILDSAFAAVFTILDI
jgi:phospholipid/cholesterol/gamma-HCH transport system permease protein